MHQQRLTVIAFTAFAVIGWNRILLLASVVGKQLLDRTGLELTRYLDAADLWRAFLRHDYGEHGHRVESLVCQCP